MKLKRPSNRMIMAVTNAKSIFTAVSMNCAISPQARHKAGLESYEMEQVLKLLYRVRDNKTLYE